MKRRSKATTRLQSVLDPTLEKPLLHLHAAIDVDSFWKGVQDVIEAALPNCFIGLNFQTALRRLHSRSRERAVRVALEQFMRRVPLPTVLLRWNLRLAYRNQAAAESCAVWQRGSSEARFIKLKAPLPPEVLNQCRVLKKRWEHLTHLGLAPANFWDETVRHPTRRDLRATISLKQIGSAAFARPHFLVEFESFQARERQDIKSAALRC